MSNNTQIRIDIEDAYPMTMLQKGMLFHSEYNAGSAVYHDIFTYHMKGPYHLKALQEAAQYLVSLHPVLRTNFHLGDFSEPVQVVHRKVNIVIEEVDLRNFSRSNHADMLTKWLEEEKTKNFDWKQAPLFRLQTHCWLDDEFDVSISFHHSILDGWSMGQMMTELFSIYLNKLGKADYLPEPLENDTFRDYVALEREAIQSETCREYWLKKLDGFRYNEIAKWPKAGKEHGFRTKIVEISADMLAGLKALARSEGVSLKVILLAAHLKVMSIITGEFDVVTGLVTNGRPEEADADRALGLFLNTAPFRIKLRGGTWQELVRQVSNAEKEMLPYRRYPLAEIKRQTGNRPLFESMFNYMNFHVYKRGDGYSGYLQILDISGFEQTNFPLASQFLLNHSGDVLSLTLVYDASEYSCQQLEAIGKSFTDTFSSMLQGLDNLYMASKTVTYWENRFKEKLTTLDLRTDYPLIPNKNFNSSEVQFAAGKVTKDTLLAVGRQNNATLYSVLLAIFNVFLYKYTGQKDVTVWSPMDGIGLHNQEGISGLPNYLAMNNVLKDEEMFNQFLIQVRDGVDEALDCQDRSFEAVMRNRCAGQRRNKEPLYDVLFSLTTEIGNQLANDKRVRDFVLAVDAVEGDEGILFTFRGNVDLFTNETITRMKIHFANILEQITVAPDSIVKEITLITNQEREWILGELNATAADYEREKPIYRLFEEQVVKTPDKIAVVHKGQELTYSDFNRKANRLARALRRKGVGSNSIVGIMTERSLEMLIGIFAILKAGGAYMPIAPDYPEDRISYLLRDSGAVMLVTKGKMKQNVLFEGEIADITEDRWYEEADGDLEPINSSRDLAYVIYTSGSTGNPKGVMIEHHSLVNRIQWMHKTYPIDHGDTILQKTPFTFDVSVWELFWWSIVGASVVLLEHNGEKDPSLILNSVDKNKVTVMHFVPSMFNSFLNYVDMGNYGDKLSSLKLIFCSGEALAVKHVEMFHKVAGRHGTRLINLYGPTEATVDVSYYECTKAEAELSMIPIGKPIDNISLYVVGSNNELQPIGIAGELCIAGVGLARGYLNRSELTEEKFVKNPFCPGERMYRTGDLARWKADGNIEYLGRIDNQVKLRGYRIELGEIESVLRQHPGVQAVLVTLRQLKSEEMGQKLVAYLVLKEGNRPTETELQTFAKAKLPDYMVPQIMMVIEAIPLTSSGKANLRGLPEPDYENLHGDTQYAEPSTPTERALVDIWAKVLAVTRVGIDDNFFSLGGDSILSIQTMALANKRGLNVTIPNLFKYPTVRELSAWLDQGDGETGQADDVAEEAFGLVSEQDRLKLAGLKM